MKKLLLILCAFAPIVSFAQDQLQSPAEFLGYELGDRFTRHNRIVDYYKYVAQVMPNVKLVSYGETNEHRELVVAMISSQDNFDRLEEIRLNNLRRTGLEEGGAGAIVSVNFRSSPS